mgnify:CR=1 FL=1
MKKIAVLLHNVRSAHNVGSIFRTADAAGVERVYLSGYTPRPLDRFGRIQKEIAKTALGADRSVPWKYAPTPTRFITELRSAGWSIIGVEQDVHAKDYRTFTSHRSVLFIFGNEVRGLSKDLRSQCDSLIEIPMRGSTVRQADHPRHTGRGKESLNVSVAVGIILFSVSSRLNANR